MSKKIKTVGVVSKPPIVTKLSSGNLAGNLFIKVEDVGEVKCFFVDHLDEQLFSFQKGDEVKVEWWEVEKGGNKYLNGNVLTPKGSADVDEQMQAALAKLGGKSATGTGTIFDDMAKIIVMARNAVIENGIEETIGADVSDDAAEETIRTAAMGIFIEINSSGVDYGELLG